MSAPVTLPGFLQTLAPLLDHWGYLAVGFLLFVEDFGVPAPGETVLIAASVYAGAGRLNVVAVGVIGFAAAMLGDNIGYAIGHFGGRALALRWGRYVFLTEERLDKAEHFFMRHGGKIVTIARFIEGLRQANGIIAGITGMPWLRFLAFNALGAALWVGTWTSVGYLAGDHITTIYNDINKYALYVLAAAVIVVVLLIIRHRRKRKQGKLAQAAEADSTEADADTSTTAGPQSAESGSQSGASGPDSSSKSPSDRRPAHARHAADATVSRAEAIEPVEHAERTEDFEDR